MLRQRRSPVVRLVAPLHPAGGLTGPQQVLGFAHGAQDGEHLLDASYATYGPSMYTPPNHETQHPQIEKPKVQIVKNSIATPNREMLSRPASVMFFSGIVIVLTAASNTFRFEG
jgi:hypothetical protein